MSAKPARITDTKQCAYCGRWIESPHGRRELDAHIRECSAATDRADHVIDYRIAEHFQAETVKRATLFDGVVDTFATETELNGWKPSQGRML